MRKHTTEEAERLNATATELICADASILKTMKPKIFGSHDDQSKKGKASLNRREEMNAAGKHSVVIGIDEAGRGPLCGPVVAAACIVPYFDDLVIDGIIDSKKLTDEKEREVIYGNLISDTRVMWFASIVSNEEIDAINILQASLAAMRRATEGLIQKYSLTDHSSFIALIDGNKIPESMPVASKCIIKVSCNIAQIEAYFKNHRPEKVL